MISALHGGLTLQDGGVHRRGSHGDEHFYCIAFNYCGLKGKSHKLQIRAFLLANRNSQSEICVLPAIGISVHKKIQVQNKRYISMGGGKPKNHAENVCSTEHPPINCKILQLFNP